ncbi:hypothetical protein BDV96DRAFT_569537 [Lophiotrema nucula]|uniref:DUF7730 domain-containing protein n=1 Tax=Lophiotrema nucula TaxID=690887 RepID=A0A6A5ZFI9_9PLEO|nr:hypothetical protein BDV96DRAFT_569537 [Lophiotrema nucula]
MAPRKDATRIGSTTSTSAVVDSTARVAKTRPAAAAKHKDGSLNLKLRARSQLMDVVKKNTDSPLLRLPAEIRRMIWKYAVGGHHIYVHDPSLRRARYPKLTYRATLMGFGTHSLPAVPPGFVTPTFSLPKVCRQMYAETALLPYRLNMFAFDAPRIFDVWVRSRTLAQKRATSSLQPPLRSTTQIIDGTRAALSKKFPNLERIDLSDSAWGRVIYADDYGWSMHNETLQEISESLKQSEKGDVTITW